MQGVAGDVGARHLIPHLGGHGAAFFDDLGSPGGAAKLGPQDFDAEMIAKLPPQAE